MRRAEPYAAGPAHKRSGLYSVTVTVVSVGGGRVLVRERRVAMRVAMGLARREAGRVRVLMVLVVLVGVLMLQGLVLVPVRVALDQQRDDAQRHREHGAEVDGA